MSDIRAVRRLRTDELSDADVAELRELMRTAFVDDEHGGFSDEDWRHALGGVHFVLRDETASIVAHAAVVERELRVGGRPLRTGYVEAVATLPERQRRGFGSAVMIDVATYIRGMFELGALGTGSQAFYERLGWRVWRGPSFVRTPAAGEEPTPEEDGYILVLFTPASPALDMTAPISCDWRSGDVW